MLRHPVTLRLAIAVFMSTFLAGCAAAAQKSGISNHHTASGFRNPPDSLERYPWTRRIGWLLSRPFQQYDVGADDLPAGHVVPRDTARAQLAALEGQDSITWIGHMTALLRLDGVTILTDPLFSDYPTPVPPFGPKRYAPPGLAIADLPLIDVVVVSHAHFDHLDLPSIERLPGRDAITAIVPLGVGKYFREAGYGRVVELDWFDSAEVDTVTFTALPVVHWSKRGIFTSNDTLWAGFAITPRTGPRIFFSGDTDYGATFRQTAKRLGGFDYALISTGAYMPRRVMRGSHCVPEKCVDIGLDLGARTLIPLHWGTIKLGDEPVDEPPRRFRASARQKGVADDDIWTLKIGETRRLRISPRPAAGKK